MPTTFQLHIFAAAMFIAVLPGIAWAATPTIEHATPSPDSLATFAGFIGEGVVKNPSDLAVGTDGSVWVTDQGTDQVHKFDGKGKHLLTFGETGQARGQFEFADFGSVDADRDGDVYVLDTGNQRVQKFTPDLEFVLEWGENGVGPGKFLHPTEIAVRGDGTSFVVDASDAATVQQFDSSGKFVQQIAPTGISTQFFEPAKLGLDSAGNLYVPDITRIYVFDPEGRLMRTIQTNEIDNGSVGLFMDVAIAQSGFIYASDLQFNKVTVLNPDGEYVGAFGGPGTQSGQFAEMDDVVIDGTGRLLVLDYGNRRIQVFELTDLSSATPVVTPA
jgi:DNA-binding beta-propeller fold protein YncE